MTRVLRRARAAVTLIFLVNGALVATWVSRIPLIKEQLGLNTAQLSIALLGAPVGLLLAMRLVTPLVDRYTSRPIVGASVASLSACLLLPALAWNLASLTASLVVFGLAIGTLDITMNMQAVAVERGYGRSIISGIHGAYSVGLLVGGVTGAIAAAAAIAPVTHFLVAGLVLGAAGTVAAYWLLGREADIADDDAAAQGGAGESWNRRLALLGLIAFCALLVEGSVADWSGIFLHEVRGASLGMAALGSTACGAGMVIGRFAGDPLIARLGHYAVLWRGALLAAAAMVVVLAVPSPELTILAYGVVGLGIATAMPIATILAAITAGLAPAWAISRLTTTGYAGHLAGPPMIGVVAHETGLGVALLMPAVAAALIIPLSWSASGARTRLRPSSALSDG